MLGEDGLADDDTVKTQYRKLVPTLHPDKNKASKVLTKLSVTGH